MKKSLLVVMAIMMTMGLMAQCPQQRGVCPLQQAGNSQAKKECVQNRCVYSPETRAMMQVDRVARLVEDLTKGEREQLLKFYTAHYAKCQELKAANTPMNVTECREICNAELRKVIGDERYIKYLETFRAKGFDCVRRQAPRGMGCPRR